jgi:hypothetical protein
VDRGIRPARCHGALSCQYNRVHATLLKFRGAVSRSYHPGLTIQRCVPTLEALSSRARKRVTRTIQGWEGCTRSRCAYRSASRVARGVLYDRKCQIFSDGNFEAGLDGSLAGGGGVCGDILSIAFSLCVLLNKRSYDTVKPNSHAVARYSLSLQQHAVQERTAKQADGFCSASIHHVRHANLDASTPSNGASTNVPRCICALIASRLIHTCCWYSEIPAPRSQVLRILKLYLKSPPHRSSRA